MQAKREFDISKAVIVPIHIIMDNMIVVIMAAATVVHVMLNMPGSIIRSVMHMPVWMMFVFMMPFFMMMLFMAIVFAGIDSSTVFRAAAVSRIAARGLMLVLIGASLHRAQCHRQ